MHRKAILVKEVHRIRLNVVQLVDRFLVINESNSYGEIGSRCIVQSLMGLSLISCPMNPCDVVSTACIAKNGS